MYRFTLQVSLTDIGQCKVGDPNLVIRKGDKALLNERDITRREYSIYPLIENRNQSVMKALPKIRDLKIGVHTRKSIRIRL